MCMDESFTHEFRKQLSCWLAQGQFWFHVDFNQEQSLLPVCSVFVTLDFPASQNEWKRERGEGTFTFWTCRDVAVTLSKGVRQSREEPERVRQCPLWEFSQIHEKTVRSSRNADSAEKRSVRFSLLCELSITKRAKDSLRHWITELHLLSVICIHVA